MIPGEYILAKNPIDANIDRETIELNIINEGDRPVQVGSHFHFFEVNRALRFERDKAFGMRLNIPSGVSVRFEPGDEKTVTLTTLVGTRTVFGLNNLTNGALDEPEVKSAAIQKQGEKM
ncbi:MAG: urease subunit beta [Candidatus Poribacteria bacterium]|jgi:urease beta subunit|nr:urease subunit beta [Candidatus Poribacteria bacterium]MEE3193989.1 urease subunit beta [Candidatus Poribacteria bacterium]